MQLNIMLLEGSEKLNEFIIVIIHIINNIWTCFSKVSLYLKHNVIKGIKHLKIWINLFKCDMNI